MNEISLKKAQNSSKMNQHDTQNGSKMNQLICLIEKSEASQWLQSHPCLSEKEQPCKIAHSNAKKKSKRCKYFWLSAQTFRQNVQSRWC